MQVTVSTVGLVPQLRHFVQNSPAQLAVSLHATTDEVCAPPYQVTYTKQMLAPLPPVQYQQNGVMLYYPCCALSFLL